MKESTKFLLVAAIKNCGIATAFINGILNYFIFAKGASIVSTVALHSFIGVGIGCALLCPLFGNLTLKGLKKEEPLPIGDKDSHAIGKFVPNAMLPGVLVIAVIATVLLWALPYGAIVLSGVEFTLPRMAWVVLIGVYSGVVATFAAYLGILRAYYAQK